MKRFKGKGAYGALALGKAFVLDKTDDTKVRRVRIDYAHKELRRLEKARGAALKELDEIYEKALLEVGQTGAQIFEIHKMMLEDEDYYSAIENTVKIQMVNAEYAVSVASKSFSSMFENMDDSYMQARASDIIDISNRLISCLMNKEKTDISQGEPVIICARDLAPSETVTLDKSNIRGFLTSCGSVNSHTSILARNMGIPAIIGLGEDFLSSVKSGDTVTINGYTGEVTVCPDENELDNFKMLIKKDEEKKSLLEALRGKESATIDGKAVKLYANIGGVNDLGAVLYNDADGIGLFRSEFIYLEKNTYPTEQEQFEIYKRVAESMGKRTVIIRTLDIGADKQVEYFGLEREENPALGYRAIRICLDRPKLFKTQLRAIFRASVFGNLSIMFPMIASVWEAKAALSICDEVKAELQSEGIIYARDIEIGIMIETPAAAMVSDKLALLVDFFSIGTNDLIQYTLACDRQNPALEQFCDTHHEAVLKLMQMCVDNAHKNGVWVGICGELAADTTLTETFLRMGIDELSVSPSYVLKLRDTIRNIDLG